MSHPDWTKIVRFLGIVGGICGVRAWWMLGRILDLRKIHIVHHVHLPFRNFMGISSLFRMVYAEKYGDNYLGAAEKTEEAVLQANRLMWYKIGSIEQAATTPADTPTETTTP
jgi:hypothetical protein